MLFELHTCLQPSLFLCFIIKKIILWLPRLLTIIKSRTTFLSLAILQCHNENDTQFFHIFFFTYNTTPCHHTKKPNREPRAREVHNRCHHCYRFQRECLDCSILVTCSSKQTNKWKIKSCLIIDNICTVKNVQEY